MILGVFYYPALYYPLLACGTLHNKVGYVLGSFLSWTHFSVLVWQKIDCPKTPLVSKILFFFFEYYWPHSLNSICAIARKANCVCVFFSNNLSVWDVYWCKKDYLKNKEALSCSGNPLSTKKNWTVGK